MSTLLRVRICILPINFWIAEPIFMKIRYVYQGTWARLKGVIYKSIPLVIPTLQSLRFSRQNLNIAWTPIPIFMKLGTFIMQYQEISKAYVINLLDQ
jgi:hypothetical protein